MGQSPKKRMHKIFRRNRANKVKTRKQIESNNDVLKELGYHKITNAELKTIPNKK
jgi:hypothetical protein